MAKKLKKGDGSGRVTEKVKEQLALDAAGICSIPKCGRRLVRSGTKLGVCAHIIPKKDEKHPRAKTKILPQDLNKEPNLIYVCRDCHELIDDIKHAERYTVENLLKYKKNHKARMARRTKASLKSQPEVIALLADLEKKTDGISNQTNAPEAIIKNLLDMSHQFLERQLIKQATAVLSEVDTWLLDKDNAELNAKADFLDAMLSVHNEKIHEAKEQLLEIISACPKDIEPMLEYIELCDRTPEENNKIKQIEKSANALYKNHPRLLFINLLRQCKKGEPIEDTFFLDGKIDDIKDPRLAARFFRWRSLYYNTAGKPKQRDTWVDKWQKAMPDSPGPHLHRVMYKAEDIRRKPPKQAKPILEALELSKEQRELAKGKDPLALRGQMEWLLYEIRLCVALFHISGEDTDLEVMRNDMISLIERCYFDNVVSSIVSEFIQYWEIAPDIWRMITSKIQDSNVAPSLKLIQTLFLQALQYNELSDDLLKFTKKGKYNDLLKILQAIKKNDAPKVAKLINAKQDSDFALIVLRSIRDYDFALALVELLKVKPAYQTHRISIQFGILVAKGDNERALELINNDIVDQTDTNTLRKIEWVAYDNQRWDLSIRSASRLLTLHIPDGHKAELRAKLSMAYLKQGDATNAVTYAEQALKDPNHGEDNSRSILGTLIDALMSKGQADRACATFAQYRHITPTFGLLGMEAQCYLKTNRKDKYKKASSYILQAFEVAETYNDELYFSAFEILRQLSMNDKGSQRNERAVKDGLFIRLDGFSNWFYIGEQKKSLGAEPIEPNTDNYKAVINKSAGDTISWPAKKYSGEDDKHTILCVVTPPRFLARRSSEAMDNLSKLGNTSIRSIRTLDEKGELDMSNAEEYYKEQTQPENKFFEDCIKQSYPFAVLCSGPGGMHSALGEFQAKKTGFIHCTDDFTDIPAQNATILEVLNGAPCFMEGLVARMLAQAELLEDVIKAVPNLKVSTSVIDLLRKVARKFDDASGGAFSGDIVDGKFQFYPVSKQDVEANRDRFFYAANLLDNPRHKVVGKTYPKSDKTLDNMLPSYFIDALRYAHEEKAHVLTDDASLTRFYEKITETPMPQHFSSINLIRAMADKGQISFQSYLEYFALLSIYRYHCLPLSIDDMITAVLPPVGGGLVGPEPQNIYCLNLPLTLSQEYGANDRTVITALSTFFAELVLNNFVTPQIADEIFTLTLEQTMDKRDKKLMAKFLYVGCLHNIKIIRNMLKQQWINPISEKKLEILYEQLSKMAAE